MGAHKDIEVVNLWIETQLNAGTTLTSESFDMGTYAQNGYCSLQARVNSTGVSVHFLMEFSNNGADYVAPSSIATGVDAFHSKCGVARNGRHLVTFSPRMARLGRVKVWESLNTTGTSVWAWLALQ